MTTYTDNPMGNNFHARIQKDMPEGSNFDNVFFVFSVEGREDQNTTISEPSSARKRIAI